MSTEKLSELSKPIGVAFKSDIELMQSGRMIHGQMTVWRGCAENQVIESVYSQEYVSALEQKIAELEAVKADAAQVFKEIGNELGCNPDNESIMMAIDALKEREKRVVALAGGNAELWETMAARLEAAEDKLATPVQLQNCDFESVAIMAHWCTDEQLEAWVKGIEYAKKQITAAGFKVEGMSEQINQLSAKYTSRY